MPLSPPELEKAGDRGGGEDAEALEQGIVERVAAGERAGMAGGEPGAQIRDAGAARDHRDAARQRREAGTREGRHVADALEEEADSGDVGIAGEVFDIVLESQDRLVAG